MIIIYGVSWPLPLILVYGAVEREENSLYYIVFILDVFLFSVSALFSCSSCSAVHPVRVS